LKVVDPKGLIYPCSLFLSLAGGDVSRAPADAVGAFYPEGRFIVYRIYGLVSPHDDLTVNFPRSIKERIDEQSVKRMRRNTMYTSKQKMKQADIDFFLKDDCLREKFEYDFVLPSFVTCGSLQTFLGALRDVLESKDVVTMTLESDASLPKMTLPFSDRLVSLHNHFCSSFSFVCIYYARGRTFLIISLSLI
jgi:hypothetical protein